MEKKINIEIVDHGRGFNPGEVDVSSHMGLSSMHERAYAVGGLLELNSAPSIGTRIYAVIPLVGIVERRQRERKSIAG